jgi:similar to stage IV sporulation protein
MMRPLLFAVGYHILSVPAEQSASFAELCSAARITYHNAGVKKSGEDDRRYFRLHPLSAHRAVRLCARYGVDIRVESRHGVPELLKLLWARKGLLLGLIFFAVSIFASQCVIWDIRVEGNKSVSEQTVEELLARSGISVGSVKSRLDIDSIENHLLILTDEISWISVNIIGNVAEVEVREAVAPPSEEDFICSNIVASRNGVVVGFEGVRGNIAVKLGEAVSEGQLLVGGIYGSDTEATRFVRSRGKVIALCEREYTIEVPLKYNKKVYTGEQKIKKSVIFFKKEVKFFGNSGNTYATCDTIDGVEYFDPFGLGALPLAIRTVTTSEYVTRDEMLTEEQAREQAYFLLWQRFAADAPDAEIVSKSITAQLEGDKYVLRAVIESHEGIGVEQEIEVKIQ